MRRGNPFKGAIRSGRVPVGTWVMSGAPTTAEVLGHDGFDFLLLDMEHVPVGLAEMVHMLRAVGTTPAQAVVRVEANDPVLLKRVLDAGALSVMVPFVQTAEEAARAVAACRYPPLGMRGIATVQRGSRYGLDAEYLHAANEEVCVVLQLETRAAIGRIAEIAALPGVDALFVGPGDPAGDMGHLGRIGAPEVQQVLREAAAVARACGMPIGIVGPSVDMVRHFREWGYDFVAVGSDLAMMTSRAAELVAGLRA